MSKETFLWQDQVLILLTISMDKLSIVMTHQELLEVVVEGMLDFLQHDVCLLDSEVITEEV